MSPEIRINERLIADVPDENGTYPTKLGDLHIDVSGIGQGKELQEVALTADWLKKDGGIGDNTRTIQLSSKGKGVQQLTPKDYLYVTLKNRPIWSAKPAGRTSGYWYGNAGSCFTAPNRKEVSAPIYRTEYHQRWRKR